MPFGRRRLQLPDLVPGHRRIAGAPAGGPHWRARHAFRAAQANSRPLKKLLTYRSNKMNQARLERERHTIRVMIEIFCHGNGHSRAALCADCQQLSAYAMQRIDKCPYQADKPTCAKCPIHCYKPAMREQIRQVMRYAGPRMILSHPVLTVWHYVDEISRAKTPRPGSKG